MSRSWQWERTESGRPGMSGDIAKLFKHENPKNPGVMVVGAPPASATLLAREVIQNSWDAARELQAQDPHAPQFQIDFRFHELTGEQKSHAVRAVGLDDLSDRVAKIDRGSVGLRASDCLHHLQEPDEPLRVLVISESATTGMYGPWDQNKSHMFLALLSIGFTEKASGSGGSYGYGKAGLINGSRIRSVIAYSCFREQPDEPGVTRRLLGVTYWGPHDVDGVNHPGIGTLSAGGAGSIRPYTDEAADEVARSIGLDVRDASNPEDLGTTFFVIDVAVDPSDLVSAIERSWWPAIQEGDFFAQIRDYDGSTLSPRPMRDPVLRPFIDAWELAMGRSEAGADDYTSDVSGPDPALFGGEVYQPVGSYGLVADLSGWSYADEIAGPDEDDVDHRSLVALTRGTRMVIEYFEAGRTPPYVRGVFLADPKVDELLRKTEPKGHDAWRTTSEDGEVDAEAARMAEHVLKRIKQAVNNHRTRLKPPVPPPEDVDLPFFNDIMRRVMSGSGPGRRQPVPDTRPISIRLEHGLEASNESDSIRIAGKARFSLMEHYVADEAHVNLSVSYRFIEDERVGQHAALEIAAPQGFTQVKQGEFTGRLEKDREAVFEFDSEPYDPSWSGRLIVNGDVVRPDLATGDMDE